MPLRIDADGAGLISIRGDEMLGVDFDATGKTSVIVPFMCWRTTAGDAVVTINGKPQKIALHPISPGESLPTLTGATLPFTEITGIGPTSAAYSSEAYIPVTAWSPGRPESVRRWIVIAAVVTVLLMASAWLGLWRSRWLPVSIGVIAVAAVALAIYRPELSRRDTRLRVGVLSDSQQDEWVYRTARGEQVVSEPWTNTTWFVPFSRSHLKRVDPVLMVDGTGHPTELKLRLGPGVVAGALHRTRNTKSPSVSTDDTVSSPELVRRMYGAPMKVEGPWMRLVSSRPDAASTMHPTPAPATVPTTAP